MNSSLVPIIQQEDSGILVVKHHCIVNKKSNTRKPEINIVSKFKPVITTLYNLLFRLSVSLFHLH